MGRFEQVKANIKRAYEAGRATVRERNGDNNGGSNHEVNDSALVAPAPSPVEPIHTSTISRDDAEVPRPLRIAAAWGWRLIVLAGVFWVILWLIAQISLVVVPLIIALLLSALLSPAVANLRRARMPRSLATTIVVIGGLAAVVGTLTLVVNQFIDGLPNLVTNAEQGLTEVQNWLKRGPLHLTDLQLSNAVSELQNIVSANKNSLTTGVIHTAATAFEIVSSTFLVLFALFFFLRDGRSIWRFFVNLLPRPAREPVDKAGQAAWRSLVSYVRATVLVAFIDAVGIGLALWLLKIPGALVLPLAALVFMMAFIPILGATLSGAVAVLVALVTNGPITALLVLAAVIAVQQLEGHVLQPLIMGRAVAIHPLAVIVGIAAGFILAGIIGALVAVPIIAMLNTAIRQLLGHSRAEVEESIEAAEATH